MNCRYHTNIEYSATCVNCGAGLCAACANVYKIPICRTCAASRTVKDFLIKVVWPVAYVWFFLSYFFSIWPAGSNARAIACLLVGLPFGYMKMRYYTVVRGGGIQDAWAAFAINLIVGAIIGWAVLGFRLLCAAFYTLKTVYMIIKLFSTAPIYRPMVGVMETNNLKGG